MAGKRNKRGAGTPTRRDALNATTRAATALTVDYLSLLEVPCPLDVTGCPGKSCEHRDEGEFARTAPLTDPTLVEMCLRVRDRGPLASLRGPAMLAGRSGLPRPLLTALVRACATHPALLRAEGTTRADAYTALLATQPLTGAHLDVLCAVVPPTAQVTAALLAHPQARPVHVAALAFALRRNVTPTYARVPDDGQLAAFLATAGPRGQVAYALSAARCAPEWTAKLLHARTESALRQLTESGIAALVAFSHDWTGDATDLISSAVAVGL